MNFDPSVMLYLLGVVPLAIGLWQLKRCFNQKSWSITEGIITRSEIVTTRTGKGGAMPIICYEYQIKSKKYTSTKVTEGNFTLGIDYSARLVIKRYPMGLAVNVFYNPDHPEQSVLERRVTVGVYLWIVVGIFFLCSIFLAINSK
jgi:hypothetical protein